MSPSALSQAAVLTVSDGVARGVREDDSGRAVAGLLADAGFEVVAVTVVADEVPEIVAALRDLASRVRLVVTNGGTGLGPRDVTPEATRTVVDREVPGLAEAMRAAGRDTTPLADLSRGVVGAAGATLVVNVPGSPSGAVESLAAIVDTLPHAIELLAGRTRHEHADHGQPGHEHDDRDPTGPDHGGEVAPRQAAPPSARTAPPIPAPPPGAPAEVVAALAERAQAGRAAVLATVVGRDGDPPSTLGRKVLVDPDGPVAGTLGCSEFDAAAVADAADVLAGGQAQQRTYEHDLGHVTVLLEPYGQRDTLVAIGATPVARWLLRWARDLGYVTVVVDRRGVDAASIEAADVTAAAVGDVAIDARTDVVHTDHDAPGLAEDLAAAVRGGARFVGAMGSRRHTVPHLDGLRDLGLTGDEIARIESPVGYKIGGEAPEIALGILAGVVAHRSRA